MAKILSKPKFKEEQKKISSLIKLVYVFRRRWGQMLAWRAIMCLAWLGVGFNADTFNARHFSCIWSPIYIVQNYPHLYFWCTTGGLYWLSGPLYSILCTLYSTGNCSNYMCFFLAYATIVYAVLCIFFWYIYSVACVVTSCQIASQLQLQQYANTNGNYAIFKFQLKLVIKETFWATFMCSYILTSCDRRRFYWAHLLSIPSLPFLPPPLSHHNSNTANLDIHVYIARVV